MARPGKANLRKVITETGGVIGDIAAHFRVSKRTIYNWMDHYELRGVAKECQMALRDVAQDIIYEELMSDDPDRKDSRVKTAQFVMTHVTKAGEFITVSDEVLRLLPFIGMTLDDAASIFEEMVREAAKQKAKIA